MQTNPNLERLGCLKGPSLDRLLDGQGTVNRPHGFIFMGLGIAKDDDHTIAQQRPNPAIKPAHNCGTDLIIISENFTQILGINRLKQPYRTNDISEQNAKSPPLSQHGFNGLKLEKPGTTSTKLNFNSASKPAKRAGQLIQFLGKTSAILHHGLIR
jgi:hypothetical protein